MTTSKPKKSDKSTKNKPTYGGWEFARDFSSGVFGLLNTGRVFPAFGLLILVLMGLVVWRLPETELALVVKDFLNLLRSSVALAFVLLVTSNLTWFILFRKQKRIYENEINRLADIRSNLLHLGHERVQIDDHRSSDGVQAESYIFPDTIKVSKDPK